MARADLLVHLVRAAKERDDDELGRTVESMIAEERGKQHHLLAERLEDALRAGAPASNGGGHAEPATGFAVLTPRRPLDELFLPEVARVAVEELIEEQQRTEVLRAHGLEPRHRVLLTGPPGNGKTSLGEAIAEALLLPLVVVRYEEVIGMYLGETAARLAAVFAFARTRRCVLFFDEFDALAKERGDEHETGEIKRWSARCCCRPTRYRAMSSSSAPPTTPSCSTGRYTVASSCASSCRSRERSRGSPGSSGCSRSSMSPSA